MPATQSAHVPTIRLGPGTGSAVYRVRRGARLLVKFTADVDAVTVSAQVSADNSTYAATTAVNNGTAITSAAIVAKGTVQYTLDLRQTTDKYVRFNVTGGPVDLQIIGEENLELLKSPY